MKESSKSRKKLLKRPKKFAKRPLGLYRGQIWMAPDFDAPLMLVDDPEAKALTHDKDVAKKRNKKKAQPSR